ncbi:outer membrane beta-barrel protein [Marinoscillum furvescens]|uniref:Putative OmpL-like beta-barrel porin-2 n=1 Tax=Marinoscillum furvescens DSM 4134 TaxID=1122208 RepID=A0A3D9KVZ5_MARFU|nr:outer membrane beta-barrel protein [Marinoscillum furvescens]RED91734.1 putative OmpL-like beta-barrel porin-2 [Marinoscillum furvescens DSM 4134]
MKTFTKVTKGFFLTALMLLAVVTVNAQDEPAGFTFSGSVDTYFRTNLNAENQVDLDDDGTYDAYQAPATSFANQPGFALGMVNLIAAYEGEKVGFVGDLVFGPRGTDAVFASTTASSSIVNQLYVYWNVSDAVTLTAGNFNTFLGYEVISPTANFNYSTSYMFSYGPFSHSGLKADIGLGDLSLMLGVFNPTDATDFNPTGDYVGGAQIGYGGAYLNFLFDDEFFQVDLTAGWDLSETFYLGVNATSASDNFYGAALYLQNSFSESFAMGLRGEYFSDEGVGAITVGENVVDLTLSANYSVGNLTLIPEFRLDLYSEEDVVITDYSSPTDFETGSSLASFVVAGVYSF